MAKKKKVVKSNVVINEELIIKDYRITTCSRGIQIRTVTGRVISVHPICESSVIIQ